jgi:aminopeptidase N
MKWDEDVFGLEYDLDVYQIVAVNDFNMGAMENKGLNVFNSKYVLADVDTATDDDYQAIEGVIGHEYFHNWTGNRVTCRDWFQLTLKEGLTVFRDQQFSADMGSPAVKRIDDVRKLRSAQFAEDAGPMAHPIRPESYVSMDNFYTATVYEKGAEVVRLYHTLLGQTASGAAWICYFTRHDGSAVTCDDFRAAMADANASISRSSSAGTPQAGTPCSRRAASTTRPARSTTSRCARCSRRGRERAAAAPAGARRVCSAGRARPAAAPAGRVQGAHRDHAPARAQRARAHLPLRRRARAPVASLLRGFSAPVQAALTRARERARLPDGARLGPVQPLGRGPGARARGAGRAAARTRRGASSRSSRA